MRKYYINFIVMLFCIVLVGCGSTESNTTVQTDVPQISESVDGAYDKPDTKMEALESIDTGITITLSEAGYTVEHASLIHEILNTVGINKIEIENMTGTPESGLNAVVCFPNGYTDRDRRFYFTTEDGILFYAGFLDEDLYDSDKGGFLKSYEDVHVPEKEVSIEIFETLRELAAEEVKGCLNHPQTADFGYFDWAIGRSDDKYMIIGKVSAENSFGVPDELIFNVWFLKNGDSFITEGIAFNGERVK